MDTLIEIEQTLNQLIENQTILSSLNEYEEISYELKVLEKTQESLKAHLLFLGSMYEKAPKKTIRIYEREKKRNIYLKSIHYNQIAPSPLQTFPKIFKTNSIKLRKNRLTPISI